MNLPLILLTSAAASAQQATPPKEDVVVEARRILPSIGLMNDHMHQAGEFMIGVRYQHLDWGGANRHGTHALSDDQLMDAGYMMRAKTMTMDMAMVDLMYGVTDNITVTLSPQYVWNRMKMVGLDPMDPMTDKMTTHGFGDTLASTVIATRQGRPPRRPCDAQRVDPDRQVGSQGRWDFCRILHANRQRHVGP